MLSGAPAALDGGWGWLALAASFMNEVLLAGFVEGLGSLFVEWQKDFKVGPAEVGWIGVIGMVTGPIGCIVAGGLSNRVGARPVVIAGGLGFAALLFASSFTTKLWHLYILFGIQSVFIGVAYQPSVTIIGHYFEKKIGIANGITYSGVGVGIIIIPLIVQTLSWKYTWRGAVQIISALMLLVCLCGALFRPSARERYFLLQNKMERKNIAETTSRRTLKYSILSFVNFLGFNLLWENYRFLIVTTSCIILGYGYYGSIVFFSSRAVFEVGLSSFQGALLLSFIGVGSTISRATHGILLDLNIISPLTLYSLACCITGIVDFLNPFANSFNSLIVIAVTFGMSTGLVFAVSIMCIRKVLKPDQVAHGFGVILLFNGFGTFVGVFVMGSLVESTESYTISFITAGIAMLLAGLVMALDTVYVRCSHGIQTTNENTKVEEEPDCTDHLTASENRNATSAL